MLLRFLNLQTCLDSNTAPASKFVSSHCYYPDMYSLKYSRNSHKQNWEENRVLSRDQSLTDQVTEPKPLDNFSVRGFDVLLCVFLFLCM